jgi:hypothetical protein
MEIDLELIASSQLYENMRSETGPWDAYNSWFITDLTTRTGLNTEQLRQVVLGLDISMILADNTILNTLGAYGFKNYDALCLAYVRHVEERLYGMFANVDELGDYVKNAIRKYTCIDGVLLEDQFRCRNCIDAINNEHLWCLKRMKDDICDPKWCGILDYALLKDNLEIIKCVYENGARPGERVCYGHFLGKRIPALVQSLIGPEWCDNYVIYKCSFIRSINVIKYAIEQNFLVAENATSITIFGDLEPVKFLHEAGYPWHDSFTYSTNTLKLAAMSDNIDLVKYVFENGYAQSRNKLNGIMQVAVKNDNMEMVRYLISIKVKMDHCAFSSAIINKNLPMLKILFEYNSSRDCDRDVKPCIVRCMFDDAIREDSTEIFKYLMESGFDTGTVRPYLKGGEHGSEWHVLNAVHYRRPEILKLLLENGSKIVAYNLTKALDRDSFECFKVLHEFKCPKPLSLAEDIKKWIVSKRYNEDFRNYLIANGYLRI